MDPAAAVPATRGTNDYHHPERLFDDEDRAEGEANAAAGQAEGQAEVLTSPRCGVELVGRSRRPSGPATLPWQTDDSNIGAWRVG
jgi:hypothetical protein